MPHTPLPAPLYQRVYGILYRRIQRGLYAPGSALNAEDELASEFGVSRATIRQAIGALVARGIVERQQGRGTFVRADGPISEPHPFVGSFAQLLTSTDEASVRDFQVEHEVPFPPDVRSALETTAAAGTRIIYYRDLDAQPFAFTTVYLVSAVVALLDTDQLMPLRRAYHEIQRGLEITGATQYMSAEVADVDVARNLEIELGWPVLFSERIVRSDQRPVEYIQTWYRGDLFKWSADMTLAWRDGRFVVSVSADEQVPPPL